MAAMTSDRDYEINREIGQRLARWRTSAGLTMRELASRLGWPHTTLGNYESGRRALSIARLYEIAAALDHAPAALLVESEEAAAIVDQVARDGERAAQVAFVLETLDDALPGPPEADQ